MPRDVNGLDDLLTFDEGTATDQAQPDVLETVAKNDTRTLLLRSILPAAAALICGLILGAVIRSATYKAPVPPAPVVTGISDNFTMLDSLNGVKDDQIAALNSQLAALSQTGAGPGGGTDPTISSATITQAKTTVSGACKVLMALPVALTADQTSVQAQDLDPYIAQGASRKPFELLFEHYPAADEGAEGRLSGDVMLSAVGIYDNGICVWRADATFATLKSATVTTYIAVTDASGKLLSLTYAGSGESLTPKSLAAALAAADKDAASELQSAAAEQS